MVSVVVRGCVVVFCSVEVLTVEVNDVVSPVVLWLMNEDVVSACVVVSILVLTLASVVVVSTDATVVLTLPVVVCENKC